MLFTVSANGGTETQEMLVRRREDSFVLTSEDRESVIPCTAQGAGAVIRSLQLQDNQEAPWLAKVLSRVAPPEGAFSASTPGQVQLQRPFPAAAVKFREGGFSKRLPYIDARDVLGRLNESYRSEWSRRVEIVSENEKMVTIKAKKNRPEREELHFHVTAVSTLSLRGQSVAAVGTGQDREFELAYKEADSDSLKRAAALLGVGTYLYQIRASEDEDIPLWALPEAYDLFYPLSDLGDRGGTR